LNLTGLGIFHHETLQNLRAFSGGEEPSSMMTEDLP
jgi:hypothetical protein